MKNMGLIMTYMCISKNNLESGLKSQLEMMQFGCFCMVSMLP